MVVILVGKGAKPAPSVISKAGRLTAKYGRREKHDSLTEQNLADIPEV
jgi:hypothetical protein